MDSFGLGIVLSFVDNASAGMQGATSSLQQMTDVAQAASNSVGGTAANFALAGQSATILGNSLSAAGSKITGLFSNLIGSVSNMGSTLESARITLSKFWGTAEAGEEVLDWIMDFGAKSPFESMDLIGIATSFKAAGADIRQEVQMLNGGTQSLMASLGDLMALQPDVPMQRWKLAFQNALSGDTKMLRNVLDVGKLDDVLGHKFGSGQDAIQSMVELTQKLNVEGMMTDMFGTWGQTVSNMSDVWSKFLKEIADAGAFGKLKEGLANIAEALGSIDSEKMTKLGEAVSGGLSLIINPMIKASELISRFITWISDLAVAHPVVAKFIIGFIGLAGASLVAAGVAFKFAGSLFMLMAAMKMTNGFGASFTQMLIGIKGGFISLLGSLLPLVVIFGAIYLIWSKDIGGLRTLVTSFAQNVKTSVSAARSILNSGYSDFTKGLADMQNRSNQGDWFSGLTLSILKVQTFFTALCESWNNYTLSEDTFLKVRDLGILPLLESFLIFKYNMEQFFDGFATGFERVFLKLDEFKGRFGVISSDISPVLQGITNFLDTINLGNFEKFGEMLGSVFAIASLLFTAFKIGGLVFGLVSTPIGILIGALSLLHVAWGNNLFGIRDIVQTVFTTVGQWIDKVVGWFQSVNWSAVFSNISTGFKDAWSTVTTIASEIWNSYLKPIFDEGVAWINALFDFFSSPEFIGKVKFFSDLLVPLFNNIGSVIQSLLPVLGLIASFIFTVIGTVVTNVRKYILPVLLEIVDRVMWLVDSVVMWISILVSAIKPAIDSLIGWVVKAWNSWGKDLVNGVVSFVSRIIEVLGLILVGINDYLITPLVNVITFLLAVFAPIVGAAIDTVINVFMVLFDTVGGVVTAIMEILNGILDFIIGVFTGDWERAWEGVKEIFGGIWDGIVALLKGAINLIITGINTFISGLNLLKIPDWVPGIGGKCINIAQIPYLNTGGYIKSEGVSYLHPNEVVVNDELTQSLRGFLADYANIRKMTPAYAQTMPQLIGAGTTSIIERATPAPAQKPVQIAQKPVSRIARRSVNEQQTPLEQNDYSVTFGENSIVVQVKSATDEEAERLANLIVKKVKRKQDKEKMQNYNKGKKVV